VSIGDTVVLSAGTLTTVINVAAAAPPDGDYNTFIVSNFGVRISENGTVATAVLGSLSTLWLALPLAGMLAFAHRRRFAKLKS
jgi:hypothetical protein